MTDVMQLYSPQRLAELLQVERAPTIAFILSLLSKQYSYDVLSELMLLDMHDSIINEIKRCLKESEVITQSSLKGQVVEVILDYLEKPPIIFKRHAHLEKRDPSQEIMYGPSNGLSQIEIDEDSFDLGGLEDDEGLQNEDGSPSPKFWKGVAEWGTEQSIHDKLRDEEEHDSEEELKAFKEHLEYFDISKLVEEVPLF